MAAGISRGWRKDGPVSRAAQAQYLTTQRQATCKNVTAPAGFKSYCPRHGYQERCPKAQEK